MRLQSTAKLTDHISSLFDDQSDADWDILITWRLEKNHASTTEQTRIDKSLLRALIRKDFVLRVDYKTCRPPRGLLGVQMHIKRLLDSASLEPDLGWAGSNKRLCPGEQGGNGKIQAGGSRVTHQ